ncbi:frizzled-3 [Scaptodrosophila lebanonensis]|uniref:Frizzled-3 n=1 Tax=Drosophila lebanonensis TaxID=7225 RepID=A0A6J2U442_DROLE|nr:frizzled-3 [Scaptodrosophila lebanonensis]
MSECRVFVALALALFLQLAVLATLAAGQATATNGLQCQRISVSACQGLGYNMTAMPNLAGHTIQLEAELEIAKLLPLIESGCSDRARFLLCSSLFPLCTPDVPRPVTACKSLCETVKSECTSNAPPELMRLWPEFLSCEQLPQPEKHELCMQIPQELSETPQQQQQQHQQQQQQQQSGGSVAVLAPQPTQSEQRQEHQMYWSWMAWKMSAQLSKVLPSSSVLCPHNFTANPLVPNECVPQCQRDAFHSTQQKKVTESLILGLSAVCFLLTLFALVTFWAEPTRFGYPERPVLFLCLCYNLFSLCYLERIVFHNQARSMALLEQPLAAGRLPCAMTPPCLASYISTSYLSLCGATWWLIFSLCFYLSSHKKWSSEALEQRSGLFHVLAWVPPLTPPMAALLLERVHPSELTGMCTAPGFVELPALALLLLGLYFTLRAARSLHTLQQQLSQRFAQIRKRFLIFSLVFFVPTAAGVAAAFCERHVNAVPSCSTLDDCAPPMELSAWPTLVRIFFQLVGGTLTGMWVWSRKTCESYRNRLVATPSSSLSTQYKVAPTVAPMMLPKKHLYASGKPLMGATPLYAGISFHNVPVYNPNQSRV